MKRQIRLALTLCTFSLLVLATAPAIAADAANCINACGARCYGKQNPGACEQACNTYCINKPDETPQVCGSIVVADGTNNSMGWSWSEPDQTSAERGAWEVCIKTAPSCRPVITFCNVCAAVVRAWDSNKLLGSFGSRRPAAADAEQSAMAQCQERFPNASCKVAKRVCADRGPL